MLRRVYIILYISLGLVIKDGMGDDRQGAAISGFTPEDITALLTTHNDFRRQSNSSDMRVLTWNTDLEGMAQGWVDSCTFGHNPDTKDRFGFSNVGENLFISQADRYQVEEAVEHWQQEIHDYDIETLICKPSKVCGHYTQVVWAESYEMGCGINWCSFISNSFQGFEQGLLIVCNYGPAGNFPNTKPFKLGPACTECPAEAQVCSNNLCAISDQTTVSTIPAITSSTQSETTTTMTGVSSNTDPSTNGSGFITTTTDTSVQLVTNPTEPPTEVDFETEIVQTFVIFAFVAASVSVCFIFNTLRTRFSRKEEANDKLSAL